MTDPHDESSTPRGPNRAERRAAKRNKQQGNAFMSRSAQHQGAQKLRGPQTRIAASRGAAGRRNQAKRDKR